MKSLLSTLGLALLLLAGAARADVVERVVAVINDEAIFLSDLRRQATPFLDDVVDAPSREAGLAKLNEIYSQLLDRLIEEELIRQAAQKLSVRVTDEDLDRAVRNIRSQTGLSDDDFWEAVRQQGLTPNQYRSDMRKQLLRLKVLNQRVRGRVNITEEDVRAQYEQQLRRANTKIRFRTSHCFFPLEPGATATAVTAVRQRAAQVRSGLSQAKFPKCIAGHGGGELGWIQQGDLPKALENALMALPVGGISDPVRGPSGYHIFLVYERELGGADIPAYEDVRENIFRQMFDEAMAKQERLFIDELRREAIIKRKL